MYGEGIIERLPVSSALNETDNSMRILLIKTIGALLDDYDDDLFNVFNSVFLTEAVGGYLDVIGLNYNVPRKIGEDDEEYRKRIIYEKMGHLTTNYLEDIYNLSLYTNIPDFNVNDNALVSDNPYISENGFMAITDEATKNILNKKFVIGEEIKWLIL